MSKFETVQLKAFEVMKKGVQIHNQRQIRGDNNRQIFFDYMDEVNQIIIEMMKAYAADINQLAGSLDKPLDKMKATLEKLGSALPYLRDMDEEKTNILH